MPRFRFPKDPSEREAWAKCIPNDNLRVTDNTVVCVLHWPPGYETIKKNGKERPKFPPSVWSNIPASQVPTPAPPPRRTSRSLSSVRNRQDDELQAFLASDNADFSEMKEQLLASKRTLPAPVFAFTDGEILQLQSPKVVNGSGVPTFSVRISPAQTFETFHMGVKCIVPSLSKNRIIQLKTWSSLEETVRYLHCLEANRKKEVLFEQIQAMEPQLDEEACETVDSLDELEESLPAETKAALVYIAGYVTRHDAETNEESLLGVTTFYHQEFGGYTDSLDRGGLNIPSDKACQWAIHSYIMFTVVKDRVCRSSFMNIALALSDMCEFEMEVRHARILTNIFIKNHCVAATPRSTKEPALKRLKLSETS